MSLDLGHEYFIKAPQIIQIHRSVQEAFTYPRSHLLFPLASQIRVLFSGTNDVVLIDSR